MNFRVIRRSLFLSLWIGLLFSLVASSQVRAAREVFLTISPPINELILEPGSRSTHGLSLLNNSDEQVMVDLRVSPFVPQGENGQVNVADEPLPESQDWVTLSPSRLKLGPKESKTISYTIDLPDNAPPGGFYFAIVASSSPRNYQGSGGQVESGSSVAVSVSELVLVRINGPVSYNAKIVEFETVSGKRFFSYGPVEFTARIENLSNVHTVFSNQITVENVFLPEKYVLTMPDQRILPNAVRKFSATMPNKWHFGYYKAKLTSSYAGGNNLEGVIMFWVAPVREIVAVVGVLTLIVVLITMLVRRSHRRHEEIEEIQKAVERLEEIEKQMKNK